LENKSFEELVNFYGSLDAVSIITIAPEVTGDMDIITKLVKRNIVVSVGKTWNLVILQLVGY
jgi:N-acetylglucosamine-6-phosphate deacetylase